MGNQGGKDTSENRLILWDNSWIQRSLHKERWAAEKAQKESEDANAISKSQPQLGSTREVNEVRGIEVNNTPEQQKAKLLQVVDLRKQDLPVQVQKEIQVTGEDPIIVGLHVSDEELIVIKLEFVPPVEDVHKKDGHWYNWSHADFLLGWDR